MCSALCHHLTGMSHVEYMAHNFRQGLIPFDPDTEFPQLAKVGAMNAAISTL